MKEHVITCSHCGSENVEMKHWINPNLKFMHEQYQEWPTDEEDCWCRDCDTFTTLNCVEYEVPVRHILITLEIREGERDHAVHVLETTKAKNLDFVAQRIAASYYYGTDTYRIDNSWYMYGGEISVTVHDWKELKEYEYEVMKQYI